MLAFNFITVFTILILLFSPVRFWYQSKGNLWLVYRLDLIVYTCYLILETYLPLSNPAQFALILFDIINLWAIFCAVRGIMRLKKENKLNHTEDNGTQ